MEEKHLGKIRSLRIGLGGYQSMMFGITVALEFDNTYTTLFEGTWSPSQMERGEHAEWTEADRSNGITNAFYKLDLWLKQAKVNDAMKLVGIPIEVTCEGMRFKSWRILTEVL